MNEFDIGQFLVKELRDLNLKIDENQKEVNKNINNVRACVDKKFSDHANLHLNNAKNYISTKIFIFAMVIIMGGMGTIFTLANNNDKKITAIKTEHKLEKMDNENDISDKDNK